MIYILYLFLLCVLILIERKQLSPNNIMRWIIPLYYVLFVGMRGANVGMDTPVYYRHYYMFGQKGCVFVEKGFDFLNQFCYHHGWSHVPFFCICAAISILPVALSAGKVLNRREYSFFMLLFCTTTFTSFCNGMRQNMACGIIFAAIILVQHSALKSIYKFFIYILAFLVGVLFHVSVLFVLPLYLLKYIKFSNTMYVVLYIASFFLVYFNIADFLYSRVPVLGFLERDYTTYLSSVDLAHKSASLLGFIITSIRNFLVLILMFNMKAFKKYPLVANITYLYFVFANLGFNVPMVGRITMYFSFFYVLFVSRIFANYKEYIFEKMRPWVLSLAAITIVLSIHGITSSSNKMLHYTFYWENSSYEKFIDE